MLNKVVQALYGEEPSDTLAIKLASQYSARRARFLDHAESSLREADDLLGVPSPDGGLRMIPPARHAALMSPEKFAEKFAEWSTALSGVPGSGFMLGGVAAGLGDRDAVSGLGTGFGSLLGQSAGGALGGMLGPLAGRAIAKHLGESKQEGEQWGGTLGTLGGMALGGALGGYAGRKNTRPQRPSAPPEAPVAGERRAEYKLARIHASDLLSAIPVVGPEVAGVQAGMAEGNVRPGLGTWLGSSAGQFGGHMLGGLLTGGHGLGSMGGAMLGGGLGGHYGRKMTQGTLSNMRDAVHDKMSSYKLAGSPLMSLLGRSMAPAAIGALGAYAASPQDPDSELRNSLTGAGIGGGLGLIHALHQSFAANPELAAKLMHAL